VVSDPDGVAQAGTVANLEAALADWMDWTGDAVCVDRITVKADTNAFDAYKWPGSWRFEVEPSATSAKWTTYEALCFALDQDQGLSDGLTSRDAEDRQSVFLNTCRLGPPAVGWPEVHEAACGASDVDDVETLVGDQVYTEAEAHPYETLGTTEGTAVHAAVAGAMEVVRAGEGLLAQTRDAGTGLVTFDYVDPAAGVVTVVSDALEQTPFLVVGGDEAAVALTLDNGGYTEWVLDPDTLSVTTFSADVGIEPSFGAIHDGVLYLATEIGYSQELAALDLATGVVSSVALPAPAAPEVTIVESLTATPDGLVAELMEATVESSGDFTSIGVGRTYMARWDAATDTWSELGDVELRDAASTPDGVLVGRVIPYPNTVFGAYDPDTDRLLLSDTVCADGADFPTVLIDETAYVVRMEDTEIVLTPLALAL
jgi:hypothetical protein